MPIARLQQQQSPPRFHCSPCYLSQGPAVPTLLQGRLSLLLGFLPVSHPAPHRSCPPVSPPAAARALSWPVAAVTGAASLCPTLPTAPVMSVGLGDPGLTRALSATRTRS